MKRSVLRVCLTVLIATVLFGCQSALLVQVKASKAMYDGRYEEAIALLQGVLKKDPNNVEALKGLGETYLRMKKEGKAIPFLEKAVSLAPQDRVAVVNLGLAYNLKGDHDKAIALWRPVVEKEPESSVSDMLRKQITLARYKDAAKRAKEAIRQEQALQGSPGDSHTLAVSYFADKGLTEKAKPLQKAFAAMLITDLSKAPSLKVVERIRLQRLLEEMKLGESGLLDGRTAPRLGRLLGAGKVVTGNLLMEGGSTLDVNGLLTSVATQAEAGKQEAKGPLAEFFKVEKAIAFGILRDAGIKLSKAEEATIGRYTTKSYPGLLYYGEGLDAQDRGEWNKAITIFQKCLTEDPTGPCAEALLWAPSGDDAAAATSATGMATTTGAATTADAEAAGGGDDGG